MKGLEMLVVGPNDAAPLDRDFTLGWQQLPAEQAQQRRFSPAICVATTIAQVLSNFKLVQSFLSDRY